jgi:hypothetical protein
MNDHAVGWEIEAFRESDELLAWSVDLPPGISHHTLEAMLGIEDMSTPAGYPVTAEQVRAVLDYFDVPTDTAGPLDDVRFTYFISAFADTRTTKPTSNPPSGGQPPL